MPSSFTGVNDLNDLTNFLVGCVGNYDSTIDTSTNSPFYTTVIQPLIDRLGPDPYDTDARTFILSRLGVEFPDLVLQDGEPIDDYAVKIFTVLVQPFRRAIAQVATNQSFANASVLTDTAADNLCANFFANRDRGGYAIGVSRLYYSAPRSDLITPNNMVHDGAGHGFIPVQNQMVTADNMLFNIENNLYYFDIVTKAEAPGEAYNIGPGTLTSIDNAPQVVKVTNKAKFQEGANSETTPAFIARVQQSLTEKSLVTYRGLRARINDVFSNVTIIQPIGMGDPEMNRDILEGSGETAPYGYFYGNTVQGSPWMTLGTPGGNAISLENGTACNTFGAAGVEVGDFVEIVNIGNGIQVLSILQVTDNQHLRLNAPVSWSLTNGQVTLRRSVETLTISQIPGGILQPTTAQGTIQIPSGTVHIGGMMDVFIRAEVPQVQSINLSGIVDDNPIYFGLDLQTFGGTPTGEYIHITEKMTNTAMRVTTDRYGTALAVGTNELLVLQYLPAYQQTVPPTQTQLNPDLSVIPWKLTDDDVGRFLELYVGASAPVLLAISAILDEEYFSIAGTHYRAVRVQLANTDLYGGVTYNIMVADATFASGIRIVEQTTLRDRVRDLNNSRVLGAGLDFVAQGASIGDNIVLETGSDSGIYTIRSILSSLGSNDSLILDRDLNTSVTPDGLGDGTGVRYRADKELTVNLVAPQIVRIPMGTFFLGNDLSTVAGDTLVTLAANSTTNFLLAGVLVGDTLQITTGSNKGSYSVTAVTGTTVTLATAPQNTLGFQSYTIYKAFTGIQRPLVRVDSVGLLDSNSQPTGITIPYGLPIDLRAEGVFSNRAQGVDVESYTGVTEDAGTGEQCFLTDAEINFADEGVVPGYRLNIINTFSAGVYTIVAVGPGNSVPLTTGGSPVTLDAHTLQVTPASQAGGVDFAQPLPPSTTTIDVHYSIGLPSTGVVRHYFLEPTTLQVPTGIGGARLLYNNAGTPISFRYSTVPGYPLLPAAGDSNQTPRDLRTASVLSLSNLADGTTPFQSIIELTDPTHPDVSGMEFEVGDLVKVNQQLEFRAITSALQCIWDGTTTVSCGNTGGIEPGRWIRLDSDGQFFRILSVNIGASTALIDNPDGLVIPNTGGQLLNSSVNSTFEELGIFGTPAGFQTVLGSNRVTVPANSMIDFLAMNSVFPLIGQIVVIDSGPDAGQYTIESVVDSKTLLLNTIMTSSTQNVIGRDINARGLRPNTELSVDVDGSSIDLKDSVDAGQLGSTVGYYVTLFETNRGDYDGTYQINGVVSPGVLKLSANTTKVPNSTAIGDNVGYPDLDPYAVGPFSWVETMSNTNVQQPFHIYQAVPTTTVITQVSVQPVDHVAGPHVGMITSTTQMTVTDGANLSSVVAGDRLEVLSGANQGVFPIASVVGNVITIINSAAGNNFAVLASGVPFRVRGGICGSRTMLKLGQYEESEGVGRLAAGYQVLYSIVRPAVFRISSTEMAQNFDGSFYYVDIEMESDGSGDNFNLAENARLTINDTAPSQLQCDGYVYEVQNNNLTFSPLEQVSLVFGKRFLPVGNSDRPDNLTQISGRNIQISYEQSVAAKLVNDLLLSATERPLNANPLGRHFLPSFFYTNLTYSGGPSADAALAAIAAFINQKGSNAAVKVSDLEKILVGMGATYIEHPIEMSTVTHDIDRSLIVDRQNDSIGGNNTVPYNGSGRISAFFATADTLTVVQQ